jgi:hypothetical protein
MNFKKLAAMFIGTIMAAMPLAGSALADYTLGDFPEPFVIGNSANFLIVVGSGGSASGIANDLAGLLNVAVRLGGETVTTEGGATTTVSEGVKVAAPGSDLNYGEDIYDVVPTGFSETEFSDLLAKGTYDENEGNNKNDETYTQTLDFTNGVGVVNFDTDDNLDDKPAGNYMYFQDSGIIYTYTLEFTNPIDVDAAADMENSQIEIQGKTYTISDITFASNAVTAIELLGGASEQTVNDEESVTITLGGVEYTVTPSVYGTSSVTFTVEYSGTTETTDEMDEGDTEELDDGTEIGVRDILYSDKETKISAVTFYLGAQKVSLTNTGTVKLNDDEIDDYDTTVTITSSSDELTVISFTLAPEDDIWLGEGEEWVDPVFGAWKIMFTGITKMTEEIVATTSSDDGLLTVVDIAGNTIEIPFIVDGTNDDTAPGDELISGYTITQDGQTGRANLMITNGDTCTGTSAVTACEGVKFLAVNSGGEARILEIKDIDTTNDVMDIKDHTVGELWEDKSYATMGSPATISLGSFMVINVTVNDSTAAGGKFVTFNEMNAFEGTSGASATASKFATSLVGEVDITFDGGDSIVDVYEDDGNEIFDFTFNDTTDDDMEVRTSDATQKEDDDSDIKWDDDSTGWGALIKWDSEDKDDLTIYYPAEQAIVDVYIAPVDASATTAGGDVGRSGVIKSNIAVVDTDVTSTQKSNYHLILGGGSAVNKLTAEALGLDFPTYGTASGIPEDGYMIELIPDAFVDGQYVLVIAGWESGQTTEAMAKVQADMADVTGNVYYYPAAPAEDTEDTEDTDDTGDDIE